MQNNDWLLLFECLCIVILIRRTALYRDFFRFNPPLWFRRVLFLRNVKAQTIGVATIILQMVVNIFTFLFVLSLCNLDIFYHIAGIHFNYMSLFIVVLFPIMVLWVIYMCFCDIVISRREKNSKTG